MTSPTLSAEPACPGPSRSFEPSSDSISPTSLTLRVERRPVTDIPRQTWDALAARNPWATPFSGWAFQRAWWDAYAENAHDETLVFAPVGADPVAIVPLMHRHGALFFGASYHADYATILAAPDDFEAVANTLVDHLANADGHLSDVIDLRRLRCGDPAADALAAAFGAREMSEGSTLNLGREDVCPVVTLPVGSDMDGYLATLDKKQRHEIRRKVRRAMAAGEVRLDDSADPLADLEGFIDLHQKRWGLDGLFPDTPSGAQSRVLFRRLFELHGGDGPLRLTFLTVGGRRIAAGVHFETDGGYLYYNAGTDPDARDLSPGVVMIHAYVERALAAGIGRLDFLRGDESYKYDWGAIDEPIQRLLIRRRND